MTAELVKLPDRDVGDIPRMLRALAESVEAGAYDDAYNLAWVIDCGNGRVELGLMGRSLASGAEGHLLFGVAMRRLEMSALDP